MNIGKQELQWLINGSAFLGSGGGGAVATGQQFMNIILALSGGQGVELIGDGNGVGPGDVGLVIADIGAISAIEQNQSEAIFYAYEHLNDWLVKNGKPKTTMLLPIETGPENTLAPMVAAARYKLPVFDGDGGGRAVPALQLSSFANDDKSFCPTSITNGNGDFMIVNTDTPKDLDDMLRPITATEQFGNSASIGLLPIPSGELKELAVKGSISRAIAVGAYIEALQLNKTEQAAQFKPKVDELRARLLTRSIVKEFKESTSGAFDFGTCILHDVGKPDIYTVLLQNENLIMFSSEEGGPVSTAPDSINYLYTDGNPVTNSSIKAGDEIFVVEVKAQPELETDLIQDGFAELLNNIGYYGKPRRVSQSHHQPLGDVLAKMLNARAMSH
ncbi:MAG: DUF917 domain-containing protein [Flavobacteriales bacterium]|nr:DUF917 domain-containing protein [Flavobacteriales bacterium]